MHPNLLSMARRNLWRNRRRTLITLSSIAFGTMLAVLMTAIGDSNWRRMIDLAARMGAGHVTVQNAAYQDSPTLGNSVVRAGEVAARARRDEDVTAVVQRISGAFMVSSAGRSYGAGFVAYAPEEEDVSTLSILEAVAEGEAPSHSHERGIVLGAGLAENLHAGLGRKVVFSLTDKHGEIVQEAARVTGIVRTGAPSVDGALALVPIGRMRDVLRYDRDESLQVAVFLEDQRHAARVAERLGGAIDGELGVLAWNEAQPELAGFIAMKVAGARFMEVVMLILIAAGIFNTLFVSVMERLREFGVLLAVGFSPGRLFALVMGESLWIGLFGLLAAAAVTAMPYWYLATRGVDMSGMMGGDTGGMEVAGVAITPMLYAAIEPSNLMAIAVAVLVATLLAGLYPAWRAGRVEPVDAIRIG